MTLFEKIEGELALITALRQATSPVKAGERVLGPLNNREMRLYTLAGIYRKKAKQISSTIIMLDDDDDAKDIELLAKDVSYYGNYEEFVMDVLWAELRERFREELREVDSSGLGLRADNVAVWYKKPEVPDFIRHIMKLE